MQSKKMLWTGRIISALVILFLLIDSVGKIVKLAPYLEGTVKVGYPASLVVPLGIGVHTGIARVGMVGTPGAVMDFTALGDSMNIAARLASNAATGEILVSDASVRAATFDVGEREHRELRLFLREERLRVLIPLRK